MLPPINLLTTDPVEFSSEMPAGHGFYRDYGAFRRVWARLWACQQVAHELQLPIEVGRDIAASRQQIAGRNPAAVAAAGHPRRGLASFLRLKACGTGAIQSSKLAP